MFCNKQSRLWKVSFSIYVITEISFSNMCPIFINFILKDSKSYFTRPPPVRPVVAAAAWEVGARGVVAPRPLALVVVVKVEGELMPLAEGMSGEVVILEGRCSVEEDPP